MALTKSGAARVVQASATNAAGATTTSGWQSVGYGASPVVTITNGGTGPTAPCSAYLDFSADGSTLGASGPAVGSGDTVANSVTAFLVPLGIGAGGDWAYYRVRFTGNTGQGVTVQAVDSTTSAV